jgi:hypothetical protein
MSRTRGTPSSSRNLPAATLILDSVCSTICRYVSSMALPARADSDAPHRRSSSRACSWTLPSGT